MRLLERDLVAADGEVPFSAYFEQVVRGVSRGAVPEDAGLILELIRMLEVKLNGPDLFVARGSLGLLPTPMKVRTRR